MSNDTFRRLIWSGVMLLGVAVWAFAIIGARTVLADPPATGIWPAHQIVVMR